MGTTDKPKGLKEDQKRMEYLDTLTPNEPYFEPLEDWYALLTERPA